MKEISEEQKLQIFDAYARAFGLDMFAHKYTSLPTLQHNGITRVVSRSLGISLEDTKDLIHSIIETNPEEFARYIMTRHSS